MKIKPLKKLARQIDSLALETVMLDPGDVPGLGATLKSLGSLEDLSGDIKEKSVQSIIGAMKGYLEEVILGEKADLSPFESGIVQIQEICRNLINGKGFDGDISSTLISLGHEKRKTAPSRSNHGKKRPPKSEESLKGSLTGDLKDQSSDKSKKKEERTGIGIEEDRAIVSDFAAESLENLGTIEVKLMDLEQDPSDLDTINAIFRPFHTIKGVSGFLNFNKINKLAHITENLLDKARVGEINIEGEIVDIILESVDILKKMIENIMNSLDTGTPLEGDIDTEHLIIRIENLFKQAEGEDNKFLGEILVANRAVSEEDVKDALKIQEECHDKKIGEILIEHNKVETKEIVSALREQKRSGLPVNLQVKVDIKKLDNVVDMVGELAIAQSMLRQNDMIKAGNDSKLYQTINHLNQITSTLQKTAMSLRMVPIKSTFQKMMRLVRDLAKKAGKDVRLSMSGEDTEIDRNIVEEIYEPMVHMIRNSIDHGLEPPEERKAANKPGQGNIYLKAYHKGGDIVIEIEDDGRGLNKEKILKKAISGGLINEGDKLTDAEINNLIFYPGFSTAEKITDISGRGVGTDVVKSKIEKLRGRVEVQSSFGEGSTFIIRLPLTLAIVDGMIIRIADERFIIPTLNVQESFRPRRSECHTVKGEGEMVMVRDSLIPLIRLDRVFGLNGNALLNRKDDAPWKRLVIVLENQEKRTCLLADELLGKEEIVIKSLGGWLKNVKGIAGGAILGDGKVGLILDTAGLFDISLEE
ncbi:MAG: chemotaxis protein CheA [Thermodesulfobacteriota bacterium]|nr:chemotaxis protein CheA [Thermodesulfobacteriota bacterium]